MRTKLIFGTSIISVIIATVILWPSEKLISIGEERNAKATKFLGKYIKITLPSGNVVNADWFGQKKLDNGNTLIKYNGIERELDIVELGNAECPGFLEEYKVIRKQLTK